MDITCQPDPGPALDLSQPFPPAEAPDLFDDTRPDPLPAWSGRLPANRDQMLACVCGLWAQAPSCLPATLASLARALGGPAMPPQSLHDMVQALQACGAGDALAQARWPEVTQVLATALGGPDLCEDHRDGLVRLASLPASLRLGPAWLVVEALARAVGGSAMAPRHSAGLGVALRRGEYLACPENIAALLHVLGAAPACAGDAARQDANLQALVAALTPPEPDLDGPILLAGAMNFLHPLATGGHSVFELSPAATASLGATLIERLACESTLGDQDGTLHWLAVSLGRLAQGSVHGPALLAQAYARLARAVPDITAGRLGMIVLDLAEQALPPGAAPSLEHPAVSEAVAQAMAHDLPAAHRLAWLRSVAQLAVPAGGWADPVAQSDRLMPLARAMFHPGAGAVRPPVLALAAMALASPWVPDDVAGGIGVQELPLLTCVALAGALGPEALTALALGAGRGLGLQEHPQAPARVRAALEWLADAGVPSPVAQAIGQGLALALDPARLLDDAHSGLSLDEAQRLDWLEAACLLPRHAVASRPDGLLEVIDALGLPDSQAGLRHALVERVLAGHRQPPSTLPALRAAHRCRLADPAPHGLMDFYEAVWEDRGLRPLLQGDLSDDTLDEWNHVLHDARQVAGALLTDLQRPALHPDLTPAPDDVAQWLEHVGGVCRTIDRFLLPARQMSAAGH